MTTETVEVLETFKATRDGCDVNASPRPTCPRRDGEHANHDRDRVKVQEVQLARVKFGAFTATILASELARLKRALPKHVTVSRHVPPAVPDFSLEARQQWVTQKAEARFAASRRADHANAGERFTADPDHDPAWLEDLRVDVTLPVQYPWGKRRKGQVPT